MVCTAGYAPLILSSIDGVCTVVEIPEDQCLCASLCGGGGGLTGIISRRLGDLAGEEGTTKWDAGIAGSDGVYPLVGTLANQRVLKFFNSAEGGCGAFRPAPLPITSFLANVPSTGSVVLGWDSDFLSQAVTTGELGATAADSFETSLTMYATGGASIRANQIKRVDGVYVNLAEVRLQDIISTTSGPRTLNFAGWESVTPSAIVEYSLSAGPSCSSQFDNGMEVSGCISVSGTTGGIPSCGFIEASTAATAWSNISGVNDNSPPQEIAHAHSEFLHVYLKADSNTATTSDFGYDVILGNTEIIKSICRGGSATKYFTYTLGSGAASTANVGADEGVYRIDARLIVATTALNPDLTVEIKVDGTVIWTGDNGMYSVISPQSVPAEIITYLSTSQDITFHATASTGNATIKAGSTFSITRVA